jgi:hypothetical protein
MPVEKPGHEGEWCSKCGYEFTSEQQGESCPSCGHTRRNRGIVLGATSKGEASISKTVGKTLRATAKGTASMSWVYTGERIREYWEKHPGWLILTGVLVLGSHFLGLLGIEGWWAVVVGEMAGLLSFGAGLKALTKGRDRTRGEIARGGDR